MYDIKIINARFPNYDTNEFSINDICISNGTIVKIGQDSIGARLEIDAKGLTTSPGFIDIHMHEEEFNRYPELSKFYIAERMLKMGVTTALGGNCGINYQEASEFIEEVKVNNAPINYMLKLGYNTMRQRVGLESPYAKISKSMMEQLHRNIVRDLSIGIKGISFGIEYTPGMEYEEMLAACKLIESDELIISAHYRSDAEESILAVDEMISLSKESGVPMQISHIGSGCACGYMDQALVHIKEANDKGISIMADCYPYDAFCTYIGSTVFDEGCIERWQTDYSSIMLTEEPYKNVYCTEDVFNKVRKSNPNMLAVAKVMNEEEVIAALKSPYVMIGSDGIYNGEKGHPRGSGTFPRVLGRYVRDKKIMTEIEALNKMTKAPADRLLLNKKGQIKEGYDADITIYNSDEIIDNANFIKPIESPTGINYVIVNGRLALKDDVLINGRSGVYLL